MRKKINFIGIGVQKAGTSWLAKCLNEHPEIHIHPKKKLIILIKSRFISIIYTINTHLNTIMKRLLEKLLLHIYLKKMWQKEFSNIIHTLN